MTYFEDGEVNVGVTYNERWSRWRWLFSRRYRRQLRERQDAFWRALDGELGR